MTGQERIGQNAVEGLEIQAFSIPWQKLKFQQDGVFNYHTLAFNLILMYDF